MRDFRITCPNGHAKKLDTVFPRSEAFAFGSCNSRVWICPECGAETQVVIQLSRVSVPAIPLQDINAEVATCEVEGNLSDYDYTVSAVSPDCGCTTSFYKSNVPTLSLQPIEAKYTGEEPSIAITAKPKATAKPVVESKPEKAKTTPKAKAKAPARRKGRR